MATEDFTTYTETDPGGDLTVTTSKITAVDFRRDNNGRVFKDFTADFFDALNTDFEIQATTGIDGGSEAGIALANAVGDVGAHGTTGVWATLSKEVSGLASRLIRGAGTAVDLTARTLSLDTIYYCILIRAAGNDTVTLELYSDSGRTTLVDTLTVSGFSTTKWRYNYGIQHIFVTPRAESWDGFIQNMDLAPGSPSPSLSPSASVSLSPSASVSLSPSASQSPSSSESRSESVSVSLSESRSPSSSESISESVSESASESRSPSASISLSPSVSVSLSESLSPSPSFAALRGTLEADGLQGSMTAAGKVKGSTEVM